MQMLMFKCSVALDINEKNIWGQTDIKTWKAFSLHSEFYVEVLGEVVSVLFDGR